MTGCAAIGRRLAATLFVGTLSASACGPKRAEVVPTVLAVRTLPCHGPEGVVEWKPEGQKDQPTLDRWCRSVGTPVVSSIDQPSANVRRLLILSWNVGVGAGRIVELVNLIRSRAPSPPSGGVGLILLLQEAFRGGYAVSDDIPQGVSVPDAIRPGRPTMDVGEVARTLGMSLAYVPSMRNGAETSVYEREDRGNAVLSTEPLSGITAIELPFAKQRRVAVLATVAPRGSGPRLRVIAGHLDTPGAGTIEQAERLAEFIMKTKSDVPLVLGIDTNAPLGRMGPIVGSLEKALPISPGCENGRTGPWPFGRIDFIFTNLLEGTMTCETFTDRYGSDHVPTLLTVDF